ncbi:hypothetical protein PHAVU_008G035300 [Phaseolus vulgaris]|uniref:Secreted protein n=1 Tax=Phaseolus vulgaris TaxID=3885 RepID=V7B3P1_PHAVU|nr:hypothetical protein PHAVU_008G035300g [Phaseolus vulgaris]ESW11498.1 hypothetical protein PHAVU_008G035300g [Phaseolus vulgaris]
MTSWAMMMALTCSKLMAMTLSPSRRMEGVERNLWRLSVERPMRLLMASFPVSITYSFPVPLRRRHSRQSKVFSFSYNKWRRKRKKIEKQNIPNRKAFRFLHRYKVILMSLLMWESIRRMNAFRIRHCCGEEEID